MSVTLDSLKKSVGKKIGNSKIFAWLADLERASGNLEAALSVVDGGLFVHTGDVAGMIVRAKVLFEMENYEDCLAQCEKILLKDPFCLAVLKIMGDAYDKLGKEAERNLCYRQFHDMDPLNKFWKDEYDVPVEDVIAASAGALAASDLEMPSDGESLDLNLDGLDLSGSGDGESLASEASAEENGQIEESASAEPAASPFSSPFSSSAGSPFEKAVDMAPISIDEPDAPVSADKPKESSIFGGFDLNEPDEPAVCTSGATEPAADFALPSDEDDPFAALAAMLPNSEPMDDSALDELSASLDSALQSGEYVAQNEEFPVDDNISGRDVNSALADIFGLDDDLEAEESSSPKFEDIVLDEEAEANASSVFSAPKADAEDKPMSVDTAFNSIFGEDELPEEIEPAVAEPVAESGDDIVAPAAEDKPTTVDNAFNSIFGEDELPEEKPAETSSAADVFGSGLFEKSASSSIFESSFTEPAAEEGLEMPAEESLELPTEEALELPAEESLELPAEDSLELPVEESLEMPAEEGLELPAEKDADVANAFGSLFGNDDELSAEGGLELPAEDSLELPAEESLEMPAEESLELPAEKDADVANAFGSLFGNDEDLPVENPVASVETPVDPVIASPMDFVLEDDAKPADESTQAVDSAFESIFGNDDDLPIETTAENIDGNMEASADISLAEQVESAESELELPVVEEKQAEDIVQEMGGAFASMFGNDDELDLPDAKPGSVSDQESTGAAIEEVAATVGSEEAKSDLDKSFDSLFGSDENMNFSDGPAKISPDLGALETEVSGAFKGLFDMEDDSLDETKPSNKGVDFLMSGDSDDEVSASLINNPDAPLDRGSHDLDESLNTRTLAEIYFDQGLYGKAYDIYADLVQKEPDNEEIKSRLEEIKKIYRAKFGGI